METANISRIEGSGKVIPEGFNYLHTLVFTFLVIGLLKRFELSILLPKLLYFELLLVCIFLLVSIKLLISLLPLFLFLYVCAMSYIPRKLAIFACYIYDRITAKRVKVEKAILDTGDESITNTDICESYEKNASENSFLSEDRKEFIKNVLTYENEDKYYYEQRKDFFSSIHFIKIIHFLNGLKLISPGFDLNSDNYSHHQNSKRKLFFEFLKEAFSIKIKSFRTRFNQDFYDSGLINEMVEKLKNIDDFQIHKDQNSSSYLEEFILIFKNNKLLKKSDLTERQLYLLTVQLFQQISDSKSPIVYFDMNDIDDLKIIRRYLNDFEKR